MDTYEEKIFEAGTVFTPSAPVDQKNLFAGRLEQVRSVINTITQKGQHAIIYGERGVGKTSLVSVIHEFIPSMQGIVRIKINCDTQMDFDGLFKAILSEILIQNKVNGMGFNGEDTTVTTSLSSYIAGETTNPNELRVLFQQMRGKVIVIIDEFDRISGKESKRLMADTIKNISDYVIDTTFILVGVADSVSELIAEHQSIDRALVQIQMPRMSEDELGIIIENGLKILGMTITQDAERRIISLSQGLPHYTHLLSLNASQAALSRKSLNVEIEDVAQATQQAIEKTQQSVIESYHKAISSPRGNLYKQVLLACAIAKKDELGYFSAIDIKEPLAKIMGKTYEMAAFARHLAQFCDESRGPILKKNGFTRRFRYRFTNPLMEPYIIMQGLSKGLISEENLVL